MKITRIVVPTDFSGDSEAAFQWARDLSVALGASIDLLHVVENPMAAGVWSSPMYTAEVKGLQINLVRDAEQRLRQFGPKMAGTGGGVQRTVRVGDSAQQIVAFAAELGADLIVMGTRGKTGLSHALMGSVAEHVSRTAPCPVVTVKSSQAYEKLARAARKTSGKVPA
jgi:nucleotide-binding universal stress UspA family protein